jgi:multidrug resistance efflux pump
MKQKVIKVLSKPKKVIPIVVLIGIAIIILGLNFIGRAPKINIENNNLISEQLSGNIDLSFAKSGRLENVLVKVGQAVRKGEVLARLSDPTAQGTISQTKGALDLAEAQYASLNSQYKTTKKQQDLIVENAYRTLLSSGLEGIPSRQTVDKAVITGTYSCAKEGSYFINSYASSDNDTGHSFNYSGLENGTASVKYENSVALGNCGLQIKWIHTSDYFDDNIDWTVEIPNTKSASYLANKNAYELALATREKILSDLATNIGTDNAEMSVAKAQVDAARGAYQAALGVYDNSLIIAPGDGVVTFVDENLKVGQSISPNKSVISITLK